eukprot:m.34910 g.34910  ORF g.34910 m.34910 type:complete len:316 (+) comp12721_c0_seq2:308-1255(+)
MLQGSTSVRVVGRKLFPTLFIVVMIEAATGQTTSPTTQASSNRTTDTNGQTAMIIGVVIAFIVVVVLLMSIVWLFWFAPDKDRPDDVYNEIGDYHDDVLSYDIDVESSHNSPVGSPTRNSWTDSRGVRSSPTRSLRLRHDSWEDEAAGVTGDIMGRLGISFEPSDDENTQPTHTRRKSLKRNKRKSSVTRFSPSKATTEFANEGSDDDNIVVTKRVAATAGRVGGRVRDDDSSDRGSPLALTPVFRQISNSWTDDDDIIAGAPRSSSSSTARRGSASDIPPSPQAGVPRHPLELGGRRNRRSISANHDVDRVAHF